MPFVIYPLGDTTDEADTGPRIQDLDLERESFGHRDVVLLLDGNEIAPGVVNEAIHPPRQPLVRLVSQHGDSAVLFCKVAADFRGAVGTPVVEDDELPVR